MMGALGLYVGSGYTCSSCCTVHNTAVLQVTGAAIATHSTRRASRNRRRRALRRACASLERLPGRRRTRSVTASPSRPRTSVCLRVRLASFIRWLFWCENKKAASCLNKIFGHPELLCLPLNNLPLHEQIRVHPLRPLPPSRQAGPRDGEAYSQHFRMCPFPCSND